jgi:hypothetical protein
MGNCTQSLLIVSIDQKQIVLDKIQEMFSTLSPIAMDNWGMYPSYYSYIKPDKESIRIGYIQTDTEFMVRASHKNSVPPWYIELAKEVKAQLLFQDLDGYGSNIAWDIAGDDLMSNSKYVMPFVLHYDNYTPFTREFLQLPELV